MTAVEHRCIHEMLLGQCSTCQHHPDDQLYDTKALTDPTHSEHHVAPVARAEAMYEARCTGCGGRIRVGDRIVLSLDEDVWVCSSCGQGS